MAHYGRQDSLVPFPPVLPQGGSSNNPPTPNRELTHDELAEMGRELRDITERWITSFVGERCEERYFGCPICVAWDGFDQLFALLPPDLPPPPDCPMYCP